MVLVHLQIHVSLYIIQNMKGYRFRRFTVVNLDHTLNLTVPEKQCRTTHCSCSLYPHSYIHADVSASLLFAKLQQSLLSHGQSHRLSKARANELTTSGKQIKSMLLCWVFFYGGNIGVTGSFLGVEKTLLQLIASQDYQDQKQFALCEIGGL